MFGTLREVHRRMKRIPVVLSLCLLPLAAVAQDRRPPHPPPPEAFEACANQDAGSLCRFDSPHGAIEGTCHPTPRQDLLCVPEGAPPPPRERP